MPMKWKCAALLLCAAATATAQEGAPKTVDGKLLEILKRRGVIDEAEFAELKTLEADLVRQADRESELNAKIDEMTARLVQDAPKTAYKPGAGFSWKTADGLFSLNIGGRMQVRFTYGIDDDNDDDLQDFATQRVRLWLKGVAFDPKLTYEIQFDVNGDLPKGSVSPGTVATSGGSDGNSDGNIDTGSISTASASFTGADRLVELKDAFLNYEISGKAFQLKGGQFKVPYSRHQLTSSGRQSFVDRTTTDPIFAPGRSKGAMFWGALGGEKNDLFEYNAGAFNGEGENLPNNDDGLMWAGRVAVNPTGAVAYSESDLRPEEDRPFRIALGVNALYHQNDNRTANNDDAWSIGLDLTAMWCGFFFTGEFHHREVDPTGALTSDTDIDGWFAQLGYMIVPQTFEIGFRVAEVDWDYAGSPSGTSPTGQREWLGVLNYFWHDHNLKAQLDFGHVEARTFNANAEDEWRLRVQVQLVF
jgi:phosphate-selective porin OprO and OprP